jgi:tyrosyl-tRNA synthetase
MENKAIDEIIVRESFEKKLKEGKKLRIKMGFDPTKPDLHLGHAVGLRFLKKLQEDGHTIIFLIGDYTAKIGDPSGRNSLRPILTEKEIKVNTNTYFSQVEKFLDVSKAEIRSNSEWYEKMTFNELSEITSKFTLQQIIERDDFQKRIKKGHDIGIHEIMYPLMQAYDSVILKADVECGGTDQKFNMLAGRSLMKKMSMPVQDVVMIKLLVGLDGKKKMSKSLGNYIAINDVPEEMYGKVMSIPDDLIMQYYKLCTDVKEEALKIIEGEVKDNPRDTKAKLAKLIVEMYHSLDEAEKAAGEFDRVFKNKEKPTEMPVKILELRTEKLDNLLIACDLASSKSEARRLIEQGAVEIEGEKITEPDKMIEVKDEMIIQVGKRRFVKIKR